MRSPFLVFTRRLHALHELFSKVPTGRLSTLPKKELPLEIEKVQFQDNKGNGFATATNIANVVKQVQPFSYLEKVPSESLLYKVSQLKKYPPSKKRDAFKRSGQGRELCLTTTCSTDDLRHKLSKAYEFLSKGWRVEFHLRPKSNNREYTIDWAMNNAVHLRPEVICAAMPAGSIKLLPPIQDGTQMIWILEHPTNRREAGYSGNESKAKPRPRHTATKAMIGSRAEATHEHVRAKDAPRMVLYSSAQGKSKTKSFSRSGPESSGEMTTELVQKGISAESNMEMEAIVSSNRKSLNDITTLPKRKGILTHGNMDTEEDVSTNTERSREMPFNPRREGISNRQYSCKHWIPKERPEPFIRHT